MDKRAITFVIASSILIIAYMMFTASFAPPPNRNQQADNDQAEQDAGDDADPDSDDQDDAESDQDDSNANESGDDQNDEPNGDDSQNNTDDNSTDQTDSNSEPAIGASESADFPRRLVELGSLAPNSRSRMLVTLDSTAGTIYRVELNERDHRNRLYYQEVDDIFGYMGHLELEVPDTGDGALITYVGNGTPADRATPTSSDSQGSEDGLKPGDVIVQIDESQILIPDDVDTLMRESRPGDTLAVTVNRDGDTRFFNVELSRRPLQVLKPEPESVPTFERHPGSFVLRMGTLDNRVWQAFDSAIDRANWDTFVIEHTLPAETSYFANAPSSDDQETPTAAGTFPADALVDIVESSGDYSHVRTDSGLKGWIPTSALAPTASREIVFSYWIESSVLEASDRSGPVQVLKRYRLASTPEEELENRFFASYHLEFDIEIRNFADEPQRLAFQLDGPTGGPTEGWWYANKIHGRSTAIGYSAGARDVVGGSEFDTFKFLGGPELFSNELKRDSSRYTPKELLISDTRYEREYRQVNFLGVDAQYFNISYLPLLQGDGSDFFCSSATAVAVHPVSKQDKKYRKLIDVTFRMTSEAIEIAPYQADDAQTAYRLNGRIFAGPKEPRLLREYGLENTVSYGWFAWFSKPLVSLLHLFYAIVGNYGIAIIMLTILVRAAMVPISRKAVRNAQMMQYLQPEMKKIVEKYKNDFEKRGRAQRELFKRYNYNPMGGCLLVFLQLPIFIGLYRGLSVDIALRDKPLIPGISWCSNLAAPDKLIPWDGIPISFLFSETGWLGPYLNVLPIVTIVLFLVQQKLFTPPATDEQMRLTQKMMTYMMIFIGVMFFKVPAGLCIYFITSSLWGIAERKLIPKPKLAENLPPLPGDEEEGKSAKPAQEPIDLGNGAALKREQQKQRRKKLKGR